MRNRLLVFGCFAHDPQSVLTAIYRFAFVIVELLFNIWPWVRAVGLEALFLLIMTFRIAANCEQLSDQFLMPISVGSAASSHPQKSISEMAMLRQQRS